jgi:photosystem II stability/assembly factor-like uncharacterized protein
VSPRGALGVVALLAGALLAAGCSSGLSGHGAAAAPGGSDASTPAPTPTTQASTPPASSTASGTGSSGPTEPGFLVGDVTFVGDLGWALGTTGCATGRCAALARSTDDGRSWSPMPAPPHGVHHLRFATDQVGYAFSDSTLFVTGDGGRTWTRQPGGADALETLDGNVLRVVDQGGCPPGCTYSVQIAAIGASSWQTVSLPGNQGGGAGVQLVRTGSVSAIEVYGNPAGGAPAQAVLFTSADDGASWTRRGEPCPQQQPSSTNPHGEVDSSLLTSAADGSLTVLCTPRDQTSWQFTTTSTDGGAHFRTGYRRALGSAGIASLGAASASVVVVSSDLMYRSADGGHRFAKVAGPVAWLGFASSTVGHAIAADRRTVWTTTDAGNSWSRTAVG